MESAKNNESILYNLNLEDILTKLYSDVEGKIDYLNQNYVQQNLQYLSNKKAEHEKKITENLILLKNFIFESYNNTKLTLIEKSELIQLKFNEFMNNETVTQSREYLKLKTENLLDLLKNIIEKNISYQDIEYGQQLFNTDTANDENLDNENLDTENLDTSVEMEN